MRVATATHYAQAAKNLQDQASHIGTLQTQISSELRVNKPSDDPVAACTTTSLSSSTRRVGTSAPSFLRIFSIWWL